MARGLIEVIGILSQYKVEDVNVRARSWVGAVLILATAFGLAFGSGALGCGGFAQAEREQKVDVAGDISILYRAILSVYEQRELAVDVASEELLIVASHPSVVEPGLRRRFITRVLQFPAGVALNVTAEYQRQQGQGGEGGWEEVEGDAALRDQAAQEEVELGRAIEREFMRLKK